MARFVASKGSVCLDGVSLTVAELGSAHFVVALVPYTLERTTLGERQVGDRLNLEPDMIGRGFGHGLGLCQWGAQGQALTGKSAAEILRYYYPGAKLTRVY